jgi:transposase
LETKKKWFAGIDWGSEKHRVCLLDTDGKIIEQRWVDHNGGGLAELVDRLRKHVAEPSQLAVAIEVPRGTIVETLVEQGFAVFSINPKQLDRFRDRYSPAGAKDDERDALVLADALRTDQHCFRAVRLDDPDVIRLRELSRLEDGLMEEQQRVANQLWELLHRYFPQMLQLSSVNEPWLWDLLERAPLPAQAAKLTPIKIERLLRRHRIRRFDAAHVKAVLAAPPLFLAPGAAEVASEHALLLLPRLRLLQTQRTELAARIQSVLEKLTQPAEPAGENQQHRDAAILLSLPGVGRKVAATMLSEASQAIAERDYHALRCYAGAAPITWQSGKKKSVGMRYGCNPRLRMALYHWTRVAIQKDIKAKQRYADMRARGHSHGRALRGLADRGLATLFSMLRHNTLYIPPLTHA